MSGTQSRIAAARGIVRGLYALSRYVRLFGLSHTRTGSQLHSCFMRIRGLIPAAGLPIALSGDRLRVDSIALEMTPAEQSFARFLQRNGQRTFKFEAQFSLDGMEDIVSAMAFERAATIVAATVVVSPEEERREWLNSPWHLLAFANAAVQQGTSGPANKHSPLAEHSCAEVEQLLRILAAIGNSQNESQALEGARKLQDVPGPLMNLLRGVLSDLAEIESAPSGHSLLVQAADQLVIRWILTKLESGKIVPAEIPGLIENLGQCDTKPSSTEKTAQSIALESHLERLERDLWSTAPDAAKRMVLLSDTPFYVPAPCIEPYLEDLITHGEELLSATILREYGNAVDGRDAEGRRRSAKGVGQLAELYALIVPDYVPKLLRSVARQLMRESTLQESLSTTLVQLSYAAQQQRDFAAIASSTDALEEILHRRPTLGKELRPRISVENRVPEYVDEALIGSRVGNDLATLLQRHAVPVTQQLCSRFLNCSLREESARLAELAGRLGEDSRNELLRRVRTGSSEEALSAAGLISSLAPEEAAKILPKRASDWSRAQQDLLVRQLAVAISPQRGGVLLKLLPELDALIIPGAIDEIGLSGDGDVTGDLVDIAMAGESTRFTDYGKVKATEALGRLRATASAEALKELLQSRKMLHWAQPHELRIAALQALHLIDPEQAAHFAPQSGITDRELSLGPLAIDPENPWARQRRYSRVFPVKPMAAVATSNGSKAGLDIVTLSLGGGKARREGKMQPGSDVTLQLQVAMRKLNSRVLVRELAGNEITFEIADIGLSDRSRLRHLLLAQTTLSPTPQAAA